MYNYRIADAHCDTIGELYRKACLKKNCGQLDIARMGEYKNWMQIFAVWTDANLGYEKQKKKEDKIIERFFHEVQKNSDKITHVTSADEINKAWNEKKIAALLGIEGADTVRSIEDICSFYRRGVRCITLTWNGSNAIASGVGDENADFGLTDFGRNAVRKMNELGMLVDVSHISQRAFWDVIDTSSKPISATHSNSKTICAHRRNLTDEQFKALCDNGGVAGINYYTSFVNGTDSACIDDIVRHIERFCALGGENHIGLGSDFDGIDTVPSDLRGAEDVYKLLDRLLELNYSESTVQKIAYKNFLRLFGEVLKDCKK